MLQLVPCTQQLSGGKRCLHENINMLIWEAVAPAWSLFPSGLAKTLPSDGWARTHSTLLASPVLKHQQSCTLLHTWKPCPKIFGCVCFSVSTLLRTGRHPPKKRLGSKGGAGLSCISQTKKKTTVGEGQRAKPGIPSPVSWKTVRGLKTQRSALPHS